MNDLCKNIFEAIEEYSTDRAKSYKFSVITNRGLNVYLQLPDISGAALFLLNNETFQFEYHLSLPDDQKEPMKNIFGELVQKGIIGKTIKSKNISYYPENNTGTGDIYHIIIPLLISDGIIGIVLLTSNAYPKESDPNIFGFINILSNLYAANLENARLINFQKIKKEELAQEIAARTMKLVESKNVLAEKIQNLTSNISMSIPHEVRTPINQILGSADYLVKKYEDISYDEFKEILADIHISAKRLRVLFENYLFYAQLTIISTNVYEIAALQESLTPSAESVIYDSALFKAAEYLRNEDIEFNLCDAPLKIKEDFYKKAVDEITDNALKFSEKGSKINIRSYRAGSDYYLEVINNGKGMTENQIQNIGAYVQFDRTRDEQQGSGLGLSIVTRLTDLHNGKFNIESDGDKFTKVTVSFPVDKTFSIE